MEAITRTEIQITATPEESDISFADQDYDPEVVEGFERMVNQYGLWGWCTVIVAAEYGMFKGESTLGGSSYKNETDFRQGGYFEQMREEAIADLQTQIAEARKLLEGFNEALAKVQA